MKKSNGCESKSFFNGFTVKKEFKVEETVWVTGTGLEGLTKDGDVGSVEDVNEDFVFVSFGENGFGDWFTFDSVKGSR